MKDHRPLLIFLVSLILLLICVQHPAVPVFDEQFYVPAARNLQLGGPDLNLQHPPLAKQLMALGMSAVGDSPLGWRLASAIFGALTASTLYMLGLLFFDSSFFALIATILAFCCGLFYVYSRLACLEIFVLSFSSLACTLFLRRVFSSQRSAGELFLPGLFFGLALAAKWSALAPLLVCCGGALLEKRFSAKTWTGFFSSIAIFYFLPFEFLASDSSFWSAQMAMWNFHHPAELAANLSMESTSLWWQWPWQLGPVWLALLPPASPDPEKFQAVMVLANPWVILPGWAGLLACLRIAFQNSSQQAHKARWLVALCLGPLVFWALAQRPVTYYYYFLPTGVFLAFTAVFALASRKARLVATSLAVLSVLYFVYSWPLMTGVEMSRTEFTQWYPFLHLRGE